VPGESLHYLPFTDSHFLAVLEDKQAEATLLKCLLPGPYDPTIIGQIISSARSPVA
jgi:hypothetical protein